MFRTDTHSDREIDCRDGVPAQKEIEHPLDGLEDIDIVREETKDPGQGEERETWDWRYERGESGKLGIGSCENTPEYSRSDTQLDQRTEGNGRTARDPSLARVPSPWHL